MYEQTGLSVQCNIILNNGYMCGIHAIGRCATCQRAFCVSHQAYDRDIFGQPIPSIGLCVQCANEQQEKERKRQEEAQAPYHYFESGAARTDLLSSGVPPVEIYRVRQQWETTRKGILRRYHYDKVKKVTFRGRGWILGEFKWTYTVSTSPSDRVQEEAGIKNWLTALLDVSPDDFRSGSYSIYYSWNRTLVRVRPCSGGYEHSSLGYEWPDPEDPNHERFESDWRAAMQAVKRLTGASS